MNLLNKLTKKNLKLNKKRTIVTIIGIMLSVALITAVASMYASGIQSLITFEKQRQGDFHTVFYNVPSSDMDKFENNRNIESLYLTKELGYAKIDSKNENKPYAYVKGFTKGALENLSIRLVDGRLPQNENEIVIPTHLKTNGRLELKIGDEITLKIGKRVDSNGHELDQSYSYQNSDDNSESLIDTETKTFKIVGIIERPATNVEYYSAPGYSFITCIDNSVSGNVDVYARLTKDGLKNISGTMANILGVNQELFAKIYNQEDYTDEEYAEFEKQIANSYIIDINKYLVELETDPISSSSVSGLGTVAGIIIGIIVFTSVFCIKNSFDISITEKIKQYGMLRSVGATKKQIKRNVFYEATILGLIGIPLGILLGFLASYILVIVSNYFLTDMLTEGLKLEFVFSLTAVLVAIATGILTIYLSAFKSARRASKVSPIDSIRNSANIKINPKKIKSPKLIKKLFGVGGDISYKNLKRNKKKNRTTVISIVVSVFVFIALSGFMGLAFQEVDNEIRVSDFNISLSAHVKDKNEYNKIIGTVKLDGIDDYTIFRCGELSFTGNHYSKEYIDLINPELDQDKISYLSICSIGTEQYNKYINSLGLKYDEIKGKAILLDKDYQLYYNENDKQVTKYISTYNFKKGDVIDSVITSTNKKFKIEIGKVADVKPFGLKNTYAKYIIVSDEMFDSVTESKGLDIYYKTDNANKLQDDIDNYLKGEEYYSVNNIAERVKIMNNLFTLIGIFLYGFIIVISLIGITNIFNTITTNMQLRKQEFAMLKSIGMTTKEFNRMIRLESLFMGIKSLFFGIPIGIGLSYLIYYHLSKESGMPYKLPIVAIIIAIVVVFILISLIMKYSMHKINKQNTIETIRNENI